MAARVDPRDPAAAAVFAIVTILGTLGLLTRWGLTADDVAQLVGAAMTLAALHRAWRDRGPTAIAQTVVIEPPSPETTAAIAAALKSSAPRSGTGG